MGKSLKGRELGRGITQRKDGLYQAQFVNRYGKRQTMYASTVSEITRKLESARYEDSHNVPQITGSMTLDEWFDIWITTYKIKCRNTTIRIYKEHYKHLKPIGSMKLTKITTLDLQRAFNDMPSDAIRRKCKTILVDIFERAIESDLMSRNIAKNIQASTGEEKKEKRVLSEAEEERLLSVLPDTDYMKEIVVVALGTGMRVGEILGLKEEDILDDAINVRRTLVTTASDGKLITEFHVPKTKNSQRSIPISKKVNESLKIAREKKSKKVSKWEETPGFEGLIFTTRTNKPIMQANVLRSIKMYGERAGIGSDIGMHTMRHTFATRCIAKGMKPKVLQMILGHSSLSITMDLYCHVEEESKRSEMAKVMEML